MVDNGVGWWAGGAVGCQAGGALGWRKCWSGEMLRLVGWWGGDCTGPGPTETRHNRRGCSNRPIIIEVKVHLHVADLRSGVVVGDGES